jgi:hypothetical protein
MITIKKFIQTGWSMFLVLFLFLSTGTRAQEAYSTLSYSVGIPAGDMSDFVESTSWRGVAFDYNYLLGKNFSIGIGFSWQTFYEELGYQTLKDGTINVSGSQYNYVNSFPVHLTGSYFFQSESIITPFAGIGVGTIYNMTNLDIGVFRFEENAWQFSMRPEVGMQLELNYRTAARVSGRYLHAFETANLGSFSFLALSVGFVWIY